MMGEQRRLFRILIDRGGEIHRGDETYPCKIIDLTEKGFQLESNGGVRVGDDRITCPNAQASCTLPEQVP